MIRVKKFGWNGVEAKISWEIEGQERHTLECTDEPKTELLKALQDLRDGAIEECEVLADDAILNVRSVSWSWSLDIMGASICLLGELKNSNSPLVINTPHKPEQPYNEGSESPLLPEKLAGHLWDLHRLVEKYIDGDRVRQQTDLFEDADAPAGHAKRPEPAVTGGAA